MILRALFTRRWIFATALVVAAVGVLIRLGVWQLDRLAERQAFNARVLAQINQPPLQLSAATLAVDFQGMEYRKVVVTGQFDFAHQVGLRNQAYHMNLGGRLLTPLRIQGLEMAVLVDRGWIPQEDLLSEQWDRFAEGGMVMVQGVLRASQSKPDFGRISDPTPAPGASPLRLWSLANVEAMARQIDYPILPIYIQRAPDPANPPPVVVDSAAMTAPYPTEPDIDITEGNHQSYALQWFTFAVILAVGYPYFVKRQEQRN